ncbi:MAG: LysR family transcriptional regulator [Gammaproteobacteria bacterium]|nr:LysR family transcriptional regulator [Gammaproteobacteria bacterium]MDH5651737.1 LysR family transcriptional regulator [Gammaproteobacteria bacterium]
MGHLKVSLEQWRVLQAVIDHGGFAQAAKALHRSQSSISYTVSKLQEQLGSKLLHIIGRKAELTEAGEVLLRQSRQLLASARELEYLAESLRSGWEAEIHLVVDAAFPAGRLIEVLKEFEPLSKGTRVQLKEVVLSGAEDALHKGDADLVISAFVPQGFLGNRLVAIKFIAVARADHPLHQLNRTITTQDLQLSLQVIISDSGQVQRRDIGWRSEHSWSVTKMETAIETVCQGLGFAWLPEHQIRHQLDAGSLLPLPLDAGQSYDAPLYLVCTRPDHMGPATRLLHDLFLRHSQ